MTVNHYETVKAALVALGIVAVFVLTDWPRELVALGGASLMLVNRQIASSDMLKQVDGDLLLMLMGLFVVNATLAATGLPQHWLVELRGAGVDIQQPISLLLVVSVLSNLVGNNPAVMLLAPFLGTGGDASALGAALALGTGFSSNLVVFGSLAGIIVVEQAAKHGVPISFTEFARAGLPVALASLVLAVVWIALLQAW